MSEHDPLRTLLLELALAVGMIACLVGAMFIHTGSMPPLVVVESKSMIHDEGGELGSIDAGDLILVHDQPDDTIVTYAEATDPSNPAYGYAQHGLEGDVIIYAKNGEDGTPIIHRAIMRVVAEESVLPDRKAVSPCPEEATYDAERIAEDGVPGSCILTWSVPGTSVSNVSNITVRFDGSDAAYYDCKRPAHGNAEAHLVVHKWQPTHEGLLTLGDANRCSVDQGPGATNGSAGVHGQGGVVEAIRTDWVIGRAGAEIPWLGTLKLALSSSGPGAVYVPNSSYIGLIAVVGVILALPLVVDPVVHRIFSRSPEREEAKRERAMDLMLLALNEEE